LTARDACAVARRVETAERGGGKLHHGRRAVRRRHVGRDEGGARALGAQLVDECGARSLVEV
jgi:hypothetical protein